MVGTEVEVLAVVLAQRIEDLDLADVGVHEAVEVLEGLRGVGAAESRKCLLVEHDARVVGHEHAVDVCLTLEGIGAGVDGLGVAVDGRLHEVVHAVSCAVFEVEAVHDRLLDIGLHCLGRGHLNGTFVLLGRRDRLGGLRGLARFVVHGRQLILLDIAANHLGFGLNAVKGIERLACGHHGLTQRIGIRVPKRHLGRPFATQKRLQRESRELLEVALLHVRGGRTEEEQKPDEGGEQNDGCARTHTDPPTAGNAHGTCARG